MDSKFPSQGGRSAKIVSSGALVIFCFIFGQLLLSGCATTRPAPVTVPQVVQMSREGVPPGEIIRDMQDSGTVYRLSASQLTELHREGVSDPVINYMQQTYLDAVRRNQAFADWNNWNMYDDGFWYGGAPFGWSGYYGGHFEGREHAGRERLEHRQGGVHEEQFEGNEAGERGHDHR